MPGEVSGAQCFLSPLFFFLSFFSPFLILTDGCDGLGSDQFNWVIQLCCSV